MGIDTCDQNVKTCNTEGKIVLEKHFFQFSFRGNFNPLCLFFTCKLSKWWIFFVHLERGKERKKNRGVRGVALHFCPINLTQRWEPAEKTKHIGLELMSLLECYLNFCWRCLLSTYVELMILWCSELVLKT